MFWNIYVSEVLKDKSKSSYLGTSTSVGVCVCLSKERYDHLLHKIIDYCY